jgi:hypothetical protein
MSVWSGGLDWLPTFGSGCARNGTLAFSGLQRLDMEAGDANAARNLYLIYRSRRSWFRLEYARCADAAAILGDVHRGIGYQVEYPSANPRSIQRRAHTDSCGGRARAVRLLIASRARHVDDGKYEPAVPVWIEASIDDHSPTVIRHWPPSSSPIKGASPKRQDSWGKENSNNPTIDRHYEPQVPHTCQFLVNEFRNVAGNLCSRRVSG